MFFRRHFGISAGEYLHRLPAWEAGLLIESVSEPDQEPRVERGVLDPDMERFLNGP